MQGLEKLHQQISMEFIHKYGKERAKDIAEKILENLQSNQFNN